MSKKEQYNYLISELDINRLPAHIAIIMDGNGRWASKRGLPRTAGHKAGMESLRKVTELCREIGISILTVYAFSTENWQRPEDEVNFIMKLFIQYLRNEVALMNKKGIRLGFIGDKSGLPPKVRNALEKAQNETAKNEDMLLNIAANYGSRDEIIRAVKQIVEKILKGKVQLDDIDETIFSACLDTANQPDPDLLIRPSGEIRMSNFLLWQNAYTELYFTNLFWPDFSKNDLLMAILNYQQRNRRFGKIHEQTVKGDR